jgi:hypothetical protein
MRIRVTAKHATVAAVLAGLWAVNGAAAAAPARPAWNVLFVVFDDLNDWGTKRTSPNCDPAFRATMPQRWRT